MGYNQGKEKSDREPLKWETDIVFSDDLSRLAVKINKAEVSGDKTFFSLEIGKVKEDKTFLRFFNPKIAFTNFQASVDFGDFGALARLLANAHEHCERVLQKRSDEVLARKQDREQRQADRDKPVVRPGLKRIGKALG